MEKEVSCKGCGKKLYTYDTNAARRYGSPVKNCKNCGKTYADYRYHEMALEGCEPKEFSVVSFVIVTLIGGFFLYRGIHTLRLRWLGVPEEIQWLLPVVFILLGGAIIIAGLYEIIIIKTGIKEKQYEKKRLESEQRMANRRYVDTLQKLGYTIPEKYL